MDERDEAGTGTQHRAGDSWGSFLTPQASAITGFTMAVLTATGQGIWTHAVQSLWLPSYSQSRVGVVLASGAAATLLVALLALVVSRRAVGPVPGSWHEHLGRAGVALSALTITLSGLALLLSLVRTA